MNRRRDYTLPPDASQREQGSEPGWPGGSRSAGSPRWRHPDGHPQGGPLSLCLAQHQPRLLQLLRGLRRIRPAGSGRASAWLHRSLPHRLWADQNPNPAARMSCPGSPILNSPCSTGALSPMRWKSPSPPIPRPVAGPIRAAFGKSSSTTPNQIRAPHQYPVQVIRFGPDLTLITLGSEVVVDYSLRFETRSSPGPPGFGWQGIPMTTTGTSPACGCFGKAGMRRLRGGPSRWRIALPNPSTVCTGKSPGDHPYAINSRSTLPLTSVRRKSRRCGGRSVPRGPGRVDEGSWREDQGASTFSPPRCNRIHPVAPWIMPPRMPPPASHMVKPLG